MATSKSPPARSQQSSQPSDLPRNAPVFTCRHRALKAAVWKNDTETGPMFNTTVTRSYKDGDIWKDSQSFSFDDVLVVAELLRTCHGFISLELARQHDDSGE